MLMNALQANEALHLVHGQYIGGGAPTNTTTCSPQRASGCVASLRGQDVRVRQSLAQWAIHVTFRVIYNLTIY
jgi:hypothetical protein